MFAIFAALLIAADQATKLWASTTFPLDGAGRAIGLGFNFTYVQNTGAAFGIFQNIAIPMGAFTLNGTHMLGILSATVSAFIFYYLLRNQKTTPALQRAALTLILAGALGNMIDRFRLSYVIDFIHFKLPNFNFPVFNVADSCVVIGAGLLILSSLFMQTPKTPQAITTNTDDDFGHERTTRQLDDIEAPSSLTHES